MRTWQKGCQWRLYPVIRSFALSEEWIFHLLFVIKCSQILVFTLSLGAVFLSSHLLPLNSCCELCRGTWRPIDGFLSSILEQSCWPQNYSFLGTRCQLGICCGCKLLFFAVYHRRFSLSSPYLPFWNFILYIWQGLVDMKKPPEMISGNMTAGCYYVLLIFELHILSSPLTVGISS